MKSSNFKLNDLKFIALVLLFLLFFFLIFNLQKRNNQSNENFLFYQLNSKKLKLLVADEPEEWQRGLMFVKCPCNFDGMIFLFPEKKIRSFWNKNTFLDLKIYWLADDQIVGEDYLPSIEKTKEVKIVSSPSKVNKVIELILP